MPISDQPPEPPVCVVHVEIDYRGRVAEYWVGREAFTVISDAHFYAHAGGLLAALKKLHAQDSPTEGPFIERVSRLARIVATKPTLEAAIGFADDADENGLVTLSSAAGCDRSASDDERLPIAPA